MASVLACGPNALLSHKSAASLWSLRPAGSHRIDVTVAGASRRGPRGVALHRTRRTHRDDRSACDGIPVTSVSRTLVDLAGGVRRRELERAVEAAERLNLFDLPAVERALARSRTRHGTRVLRQVLRDYREPPFTRSELERRFVDLCRAAGLPAPSTNIWIVTGEVDAAWPDRRLVVELDGRHHRTAAAFERDRERDAELQLAGYRVLRVTARRLERDPEGVVATVTALLG
jgi:hypothetical protein